MGLLAIMYSAKQPMTNSCRQWNDETTIYPLHIRFLSVFQLLCLKLALSGT
jgi:hypothetical protein